MDDKKKKDQEKEGLKNFNITINEFGEVVSNMDVEDLNDYLNNNVEDKKLKDRTDLNLNTEEEENES
ncbi:MAG: hypothetical protein AAFO07_28200 [Bacteroidota bacterium]